MTIVTADVSKQGYYDNGFVYTVPPVTGDDLYSTGLTSLVSTMETAHNDSEISFQNLDSATFYTTINCSNASEVASALISTQCALRILLMG